jgi:hypothetical protein
MVASRSLIQINQQSTTGLYIIVRRSEATLRVNNALMHRTKVGVSPAADVRAWEAATRLGLGESTGFEPPISNPFSDPSAASWFLGPDDHDGPIV